ncbi:UDP-N-acetylglucosamine transferase subunit [Coemansia interrupta]|uniref:UDP-N-acetylglucosamine transferase subunit ALG14 n=1 Tax=Coemansia interrupta TaxID=1126814 RepID=A0A9W8HNB0_9FUNG|nr:UDP-N-acetylglucosamine transferase subunit [Coemansia interrupta]
MSWLHVLAAAVCVAVLALRTYVVLPVFSRGRQPSSARRKGKAARLPTDRTLCIVLGSGGHTAEMVRLLQGVDFDRYVRRVYIVGDTDVLSLDQISSLEAPRDHEAEQYSVCRIPRSRQVGQSFKSSLLSSLWCLLCVCRVMWRQLPDAVLCNGPANCVIVGLVALLPRFVGVKRIPLVYVESFARVTSLSLSGRIMYYLADRFVVQWPGLQKKYPLAEYIPHLV